MRSAPRLPTRPTRRARTPLLLVFVAGVATGHLLPAPSMSVPREWAAADAAEQPSDLADPGTESVAHAEASRAPQVATHERILTDPAALPPSFIEPLLRRAADPASALEALVDRMSDRELIGAITSLTQLREQDLDQVRDLRDYAMRLGQIAMQGVLTQPGSPGNSAPAEVMFAQSVDDLGLPTEIHERLSTEQGNRIYALFPSGRYDHDQVLVKWFREGDPDLLLFGRYPVEPGAPLSHVWMERESGWESGPYVVEFYDPSEPLEKIASGRYDVAEPPGP